MAASIAMRGRRTLISTCHRASTSRRSLYAKPDAAALLRAELAKAGYRCDPIALGTNTDPYQPIEREWKVTRSVLEVLAEHEHPFTIVTKSALVERDIDIIAPMAAKRMARVYLSITTLDRELARKMEPRAAAPHRRLQALKTLCDAGIPVGVMVAPIIPQLNDRDLEAILEAAAANGARSAGWVLIAPAARGRAAVSRMARRALPAARGARDEPDPADAGRPRLRLARSARGCAAAANSRRCSKSASRLRAAASGSIAGASMRASTRRAFGRRRRRVATTAGRAIFSRTGRSRRRRTTGLRSAARR